MSSMIERIESDRPPGVSSLMITSFACCEAASSRALEIHFCVAGSIVAWSWIEYAIPVDGGGAVASAGGIASAAPAKASAEQIQMRSPRPLMSPLSARFLALSGSQGSSRVAPDVRGELRLAGVLTPPEVREPALAV